jgi:hypothetical protein
MLAVLLLTCEQGILDLTITPTLIYLGMKTEMQLALEGHLDLIHSLEDGACYHVAFPRSEKSCMHIFPPSQWAPKTRFLMISRELSPISPACTFPVTIRPRRGAVYACIPTESRSGDATSECIPQ